MQCGYANNRERDTEKMNYELYHALGLSGWFAFRVLLDTVKIPLLGEKAERISRSQPTLRNSTLWNTSWGI